MTLKAFKVRLYPNQKQSKQIMQTFGSTRFVWNQMLAMQSARHKNNPRAKYQNEFAMNLMLKALKIEYPWLKDVDATALQATNGTLHGAFQRFFNKKLRNGYPRFKSKKHYAQSYTSKAVNQNIRVIDDHHLKLPKLGQVYFRAGRILTGKVKRATVRINSQGQYYATVLVESEKQAQKPKTKQVVGIDLGLDSLMILSIGQKVNMVHFDTDAKKQIRVWERKMARRRQNARKEIAFDKHEKVLFPRTSLRQFPRYQQARRTVAKLKQQVSNRRYDKLQKLTTQLVQDYDVIVVEKLNTQGMLKNHHLARAIANAGWGQLVTMLRYKCDWYGKQLIMVDPKNTSRICNACGQKNYQFDGLSQHEWLAVREWQCPSCGTRLDRDVNASQNILNRGLAQFKTKKALA